MDSTFPEMELIKSMEMHWVLPYNYVIVLLYGNYILKIKNKMDQDCNLGSVRSTQISAN